MLANGASMYIFCTAGWDGQGWSGLVGGMERVGMVCSRYTLYSIKNRYLFSDLKKKFINDREIEQVRIRKHRQVLDLLFLNELIELRVLLDKRK